MPEEYSDPVKDIIGKDSGEDPGFTWSDLFSRANKHRDNLSQKMNDYSKIEEGLEKEHEELKKLKDKEKELVEKTDRIDQLITQAITEMERIEKNNGRIISILNTAEKEGPAEARKEMRNEGFNSVVEIEEEMQDSKAVLEEVSDMLDFLLGKLSAYESETESLKHLHERIDRKAIQASETEEKTLSELKQAMQNE